MSEQNEEAKISQDESGLQSFKTAEPPTSQTHNHFLMLAVAHYNLAVEYEYLSEFNEAIFSINSAMEIVKSHIGPQHSLSKKIDELRWKL